jgi:putative phosphoesterase
MPGPGEIRCAIDETWPIGQVAAVPWLRMRFAIVGDVHTEDETLRRVLAFVRREGIEAVLAVGDVVDGPGDAVACCRLLEDAGALVVRGNHDRWFLSGAFRQLPAATQPEHVDAAARSFLESLPAVRRVATPRGPLLLCHGTGEDDMHAVGPDDAGYALEANDSLQLALRDPELRILVGGHSHRRMVRRIGSLALINAGTLARGEDPAFGVVDLERREVTFFSCDRGRIARAEVVALPV